jgi:hypothetical protein
MATATEIMVAGQGTYVVNDTNEAVVSHDAILTLEDTVFTSISVAGSDVKTDYIADTAVAVKAGAFIRPKNGSKFSAVELASGSVILVL